MVQVLGKHFIIEACNCKEETLDNIEYVENTLLNMAEKHEFTVVNSYFHKFSPQGVSGVVVIAESHISIHTWPEKNYAAIDCFSCDMEVELESISDFLKASFGAEKLKSYAMDRGYLA